jgi:hypothetical protein
MAGAVFEKQARVDFLVFDDFIEAGYPGFTARIEREGSGKKYVLYYSREGKHVGTYVFNDRTGYFGGTRIGSRNPWRKFDEPLVKESFQVA